VPRLEKIIIKWSVRGKADPGTSKKDDDVARKRARPPSPARKRWWLGTKGSKVDAPSSCAEGMKIRPAKSRYARAVCTSSSTGVTIPLPRRRDFGGVLSHKSSTGGATKRSVLKEQICVTGDRLRQEDEVRGMDTSWTTARRMREARPAEGRRHDIVN